MRTCRRCPARGRWFGRPEDASAQRVEREAVEEPRELVVVVVWEREAEPRDGAVARHHLIRHLRRAGRRQAQRVRGQAFATATSASGSTNSCSGCRTVRTGQGAVRTTRSETLPINRCAKPLRPCVPITIKSVPISYA